MFPIPKLSMASVAFPADALDWMPKHKDIPDVDKKWDHIASKWFYSGLPKDVKFYPKEGVNPKDSMRAMQACLGSFAPKHEHKMAAAAFLLSEWFVDIKNWDGETAVDRKLKERLGGRGANS